MKIKVIYTNIHIYIHTRIFMYTCTSMACSPDGDVHTCMYVHAPMSVRVFVRPGHAQLASGPVSGLPVPTTWIRCALVAVGPSGVVQCHYFKRDAPSCEAAKS